MKKTKTIISLIIFLITVLSVANIVASNAVATTGNKLGQLHLAIQTLESQNQQLQRQISQYRSLSYIASRAKDLGFVPIDQTATILLPKPLAKIN